MARAGEIRARRLGRRLTDQHELEQLQEEDARDLPRGSPWARTPPPPSVELRGERAGPLPRDRPPFCGQGGAGAGREPVRAGWPEALAHRGSLDEASAFVPATERSIASGRWLEAQCEIAADREDWDGAQALLVRARTEAAECGLLALPFSPTGSRDGDGQRLPRPRPARVAPAVGRRFRQLGAVWEEAWSRLLAAETLLAVDGGRARDEAPRGH